MDQEREQAADARDYLAWGLHIRSDVPLPQLRAGSGGEPDVRITLGEVPALGPPFTPLAGVAQAAPGAFVLLMAGAARYGVYEGARIVVEPLSGAAPADIATFLLGSAIGVLLHQRGLLPLHASAVAIGASAVAFVGASGAGKSTLALGLQQRGHALVSDDICALDVRDDPPSVWPGTGRLKLWQQSVDAAGLSSVGLDPVIAGADKFSMPAATPADHRPYALHALYLLDYATGDAAGFRRLHGAEAVHALVANSFRGIVVAPMGLAAGHLAACVHVARTVPLFAFSRGRDIAALDRHIIAVECHLEDGVPATRTPV